MLTHRTSNPCRGVVSTEIAASDHREPGPSPKGMVRPVNVDRHLGQGGFEPPSHAILQLRTLI